jgi:C-terminal processing protease CtpA/Prc
MPRVWRNIAWPSALLCALFLFPSAFARPERYTKADREFAQQMLNKVAADIPKYYYDSKLHGVDWDAKVREAKKNIDAADSLNGAVSEIAALLDNLNDSHTSFYPPPRTTTHDYGFRMEMIGEHCFVTRVDSGSDAERKGLKPGNEILAVNDQPVSRKTIWRIQYIYDVLRPQPGLRLTLADTGSQPRKLEVIATIRASTLIKYFQHQGINQIVRDSDNSHHARQARYFEKGDDLLVVKIPMFAFSAEEADHIIGNMRKHKGVVLDLRGNHGGFTGPLDLLLDGNFQNDTISKVRKRRGLVLDLRDNYGEFTDTLDRLLGGIFQYDRKICDRVGRDSTKPVVATGRHNGAFAGKFVVLIDSESASASEVFARVVQLERRGFVMGDRSAGMVMESRFYPHEVTLDAVAFYGASITDADLVMADGKSLEHVGVEPDIVILPTAQDLANGRDPVLAKAAGMVGVKLSPEEAGTAIPYEYPKGE